MEFLSELLAHKVDTLAHITGQRYLKIGADNRIVATTDVEETDPTVPSYVKAITSGDINQWNQAYSWGDFREFGLGTSSNTLADAAAFDDLSRFNSFITRNTASNNPFSAFGVGLHLRHNGSWAAQLWAQVGTNQSLKYRSTTSAGNWGPVRTVWDDGNFIPGNYTPGNRTLTGGNWIGPIGDLSSDRTVEFRPTAGAWALDSEGNQVMYLNSASSSTNGWILRASHPSHNFQFRNSANVSVVRWTNTGILDIGTVPWERLSNVPSFYPQLGLFSGDLDAAPSGVARVSVDSTNLPFLQPGLLLTYGFTSNGGGQILVSRNSAELAFRGYNSGPQPWRTVWHSGNFVPGNYVLKSGDTMTGLLNIAQSVGTPKLSLIRSGSNTDSTMSFVTDNGETFIGRGNSSTAVFAVGTNTALSTPANRLFWVDSTGGAWADRGFFENGVTINSAPTAPSHATNKGYVDSLLTGYQPIGDYVTVAGALQTVTGNKTFSGANRFTGLLNLGTNNRPSIAQQTRSNLWYSEGSNLGFNIVQTTNGNATGFVFGAVQSESFSVSTSLHNNTQFKYFVNGNPNSYTAGMFRYLQNNGTFQFVSGQTLEEGLGAGDDVVWSTTMSLTRAGFLSATGSITAGAQLISTTDVVIGTGVLQNNGTSKRDKIRVWSSGIYTIGMESGYNFGGLGNDFAMTFQMSNTNARGWWWGDEAHTNSQGAMALRTDGRLTVAHSFRLGYGEADTTTPGVTYVLDVNGNSFVNGQISIGTATPTLPEHAVRKDWLEANFSSKSLSVPILRANKVSSPSDYTENESIDSNTFGTYASFVHFQATDLPFNQPGGLLSIGSGNESTGTGSQILGRRVTGTNEIPLAVRGFNNGVLGSWKLIPSTEWVGTNYSSINHSHETLDMGQRQDQVLYRTTANTIYGFINASGSLGYPGVTGSGLAVERRSTATNYSGFTLWTAAGTDDILYFQKKRSGDLNSYSPWYQIYHEGNFNPNNYVTIDTNQAITGIKIFSNTLRTSAGVVSADGAAGSGNSQPVGISYINVDSDVNYPINSGVVLSVKVNSDRQFQIYNQIDQLWFRSLHSTVNRNWQKLATESWVNSNFPALNGVVPIGSASGVNSSGTNYSGSLGDLTGTFVGALNSGSVTGLPIASTAIMWQINGGSGSVGSRVFQHMGQDDALFFQRRSTTSWQTVMQVASREWVTSGFQPSGSYVNLQTGTPGTAQTGHINITGTIISPIITSTSDLNLGSAGGSSIEFNPGGTNKGKWDASGRLGIGLIPNSIRSSLLEVAGNIWSEDAFILGTTSSPTAEFGLSGGGINGSAFLRMMGTGNLDFQTGVSITRMSINGSNGSVTLTSIPALASSASLFLVSNAGIISSRTSAQLLADIGAQSAGDYVTRTTTQTITGSKTFSLPIISSYNIPSVDGTAGSGNVIENGISMRNQDNAGDTNYPSATVGTVVTFKANHNRAFQIYTNFQGVTFIRGLHTTANNSWRRLLSDADTFPYVSATLTGGVANISHSGVDLDTINTSSFAYVNSGTNIPGGYTQGFVRTNAFSTAFHQEFFQQGNQDAWFYRRKTSGTVHPWLRVASREWVTDQGYLTSADLSGYVPSTRTLVFNGGGGVFISPGGVQNLSSDLSWNISLTGQAAAFHELSTSGFVVRKIGGIVESRFLTQGTGITILNNDGFDGHPTISFNQTYGDGRYARVGTQGTYTPVLKAGTSDLTIDSSSPILRGKWYRIGNLGYVSIYINFSSTPGFTGSGNIAVTLPSGLFSVGEQIDGDFIGSATLVGIDFSLTTNRSPYYVRANPTNNWLELYATGPGTTQPINPVNWNHMINGISGSINIMISATFRIL